MGLSGLITPSLTEMVNVATEMQRRGMNLPLLIGGATTSRQHTAVKIAPAYEQPVVHVIDASRVVGRGLQPARPGTQGDAGRREPRRSGPAPGPARREGEDAAPALPQGAREPHARSSGVPTTWLPHRSLGAQVVEPALTDLRALIDWTFFFTAWELKGRYPADPGPPPARARRRANCSRTATSCSTPIIADGSIQARGVYGFWPAQAEGDDIVLADGSVFPMLRQQVDHGDPTTTGRTGRSPTTSRRPRAGSPITWVASRSRPDSARTSSPRPSKPTSTTTARSWSRRSPTGSPRRSPNGSTARCDAPGTHPSEDLPRHGPRSRSATGASGPPSATRRVPTTPRSARCSTCWARVTTAWI